jgi:hypothetical protein
MAALRKILSFNGVIFSIIASMPPSWILRLEYSAACNPLRIIVRLNCEI